jgi:hypothetical protein
MYTTPNIYSLNVFLAVSSFVFLAGLDVNTLQMQTKRGILPSSFSQGG